MSSSIDGQVVWWIEDGKLGIGTYSNGTITSIQEIKTVRVHAEYVPAGFTTDLTEEPNLPQHLHNAIIAPVLEELYARKGLLPMMQYWSAKWKEYIKDGIRWKNKSQDATAFSIKQHDK